MRKWEFAMDISEFMSIVSEVKENKPILFGLESDKAASDNEIEQIEEYYGVGLPKSYKEFLKEFGGGYFGYIVVYSCDRNSRFYLGNNVLKEWIDTYNFFPVMDFETGDLCGFKIYDNKCGEYMCMFDHEEKQVREENEYDFFQTLAKYGFKL